MRFFLVWSIIFYLLFGAKSNPIKSEKSENNISSETNLTEVIKKLKPNELNPSSQNRVEALMEKLSELEKNSDKGNVWTKIYSSYQTYRELKNRQSWLNREVFKLKRKEHLSKDEKKLLEKYEIERETNAGKLQLLSEFQSDPFKKLLEPPKIPKAPEVGNPIGIIGALSFIKRLRSDQQAYEDNFLTLKKTLENLKEQERILKEMLKYQPNGKKFLQKSKAIATELEALEPTFEIFKTTKDVYRKKIEEAILKTNEEIKKEVQKAINIGGIILFLFILFLIFKRVIRKYMAERESFYTVNKVANFIFINIVILVLLFAYIENVDYMVTILGFASAGIAIAMKDWFMSLMGWFVIVLGGSIHVGDRIKVVRGKSEYVGDVVDISLFKMTIHEDITLTTLTTNRRSGRIIFIPNNYIFTDMIANYSHAGLKTVWDGIDFIITYESNYQKASNIAKEVVKKYSKGYTDITRKQLNKLRSNYHLKNTNVEPRVFTFFDNYGVRVSAWYMTNAFATLTLRSTISNEILQRIMQEDDIELAYPTQSLYFSRHQSKNSSSESDENGKGLEV
jgi:small-conductance mechanosensitive channel